METHDKGLNGSVRRGQPTAAAGLFTVLLCFTFMTVSDVSAGYKMSGGSLLIARNNIGTEGRRTESGDLVLNTTVGEAGITQSSGGGVRLYPGYVKLAAQPGSVTSITAVTKSTGALELAWQTPGLDGFKGDVINGFYRVDYSSDPAHIFGPTIYRLELSTTVKAESSQALTIRELLPNTTYYSKIYLAGAHKYFSENSRRSDESTLANVPLNPVLARISPCMATITWELAAGGAQDYRTEASTTNFGALSPGGNMKSAQTPNGLQASMTLAGLSAGTTYYFKIASRNWQGDKNFAAIISAVTFAGACVSPVTNLAAVPDHMSRAVTLTWADPSDPAVQGVLVVLSTSPVADTPPDGYTFNPGQVFGGGALVRGTASTNTFTDSGLTLDTPYFYHLYTQGTGFTYSVSVSTSIFLDLPPMAPAGLSATVSPDRRVVLLAWRSVRSNRDGSPFFSSTEPMAAELAQYHIERATSIVNSNWVSVATVPVTAHTYVEDLPEPGRTYFYRISAVDSLNSDDTAMVVDTEKNLFVTAPDQVTRLHLPPSLSDSLLAGRNPLGRDILIRAVEEPEKVEDKVFTSVRFTAYTAEDNKAIKQFRLPGPESAVTLGYKVSGDRVVPSGASALGGRLSAANTPQNLGMYWNNGEKYVKLYGDVDSVNHTVSVKTPMTGSYQIRSMARESVVSFDISGLTNRMITPNGDGLNDAAVFSFDNPKDSGFSGKIFDVEGAFVADMASGPVLDSLKWDGKANGRTVPGGVYVYQIRAENKTFSGTLVVIR